jgi:LacI family transcriptional regulator
MFVPPAQIEVFVGAAPILEVRLIEGLLAYGDTHPGWRFVLRGADTRHTPSWLRRQGVRGALVLIEAERIAPVLDAAGVPWVHLLPGTATRHPAVTVDDVAIGRMGAEMYLEKGFRKFAFCGVGTVWSSLRAEGFRQRLAEAGLECRRQDFRFDTGKGWTLVAGVDRSLRRWLRGLDRVTAVMAGHDALANRLVDLCGQEGVRVPDDLAILGVGNHDLLCRLSAVPISSIDCALPEIAARGLALLEAMIGRRPHGRTVVVQPRGVVSRRSTEVLGFENDLINRLVGYIRDHACEGLNVDRLARQFPVSRRTLDRRFREYLGHSPAEEIRRARLREARRLIEQTDRSLTGIAADCGYADLSHLDRVFRRAFGRPPGDLRSGGGFTTRSAKPPRRGQGCYP